MRAMPFRILLFVTYFVSIYVDYFHKECKYHDKATLLFFRTEPFHIQTVQIFGLLASVKRPLLCSFRVRTAAAVAIHNVKRREISTNSSALNSKPQPQIYTQKKIELKLQHCLVSHVSLVLYSACPLQHGGAPFNDPRDEGNVLLTDLKRLSVE